MDEQAHELKLHVSGFPLSLVNGLRRIVMAEVPCFAFDNTVQVVNTGALPLERVHDRLALVPVAVPGVDLLEAERAYTAGDEEVRRKIALRFVLLDECATQADCSPGCTFRRTTAASLQWMPQTTGESVKQPALRPRPVYSDMPITNLPIGSRIHTYAVCVPGTGTLHSKWSPACPCTCVTLEPQARCMPAEARGGGADGGRADGGGADGGGADGGGAGHAAQEDRGVLFSVETTGAITPAEAVNYGVRKFLQKIDALLAAFENAP